MGEVTVVSRVGAMGLGGKWGGGDISEGRHSTPWWEIGCIEE